LTYACHTVRTRDAMLNVPCYDNFVGKKGCRGLSSVRADNPFVLLIQKQCRVIETFNECMYLNIRSTED